MDGGSRQNNNKTKMFFSCTAHWKRYSVIVKSSEDRVNVQVKPAELSGFISLYGKLSYHIKPIDLEAT